MPIKKIISGGQTGVDRAALDVALALGIPCGGWCPKHRASEDGPIDPRYPMEATKSADPAVRTRLNVRDADTILIIARPPLTGGTLLTKQIAVEYGRPCLVVDPQSPRAVPEVVEWIKRAPVGVLNVAGPRESQSPGVGEQTRKLLQDILAEMDIREKPD